MGRPTVSIKTAFVVLLAIVCGVSAAWGMRQLSRNKTIRLKTETVPIVVTTGKIPRGGMVTDADIKVCQWPKGLLPEGAVTRVEDALERAAIVPLMPGEPILDVKLASKDAGRGLAALIPKGMRAYTIRASRVASNVAGFILPGNRVDVLLTLKGRYNDDTGGGSTTTLLQAVEILAVDQQLDAPAENRIDPKGLRSVTLLVTPEQAGLLDLGQNMGQLTLSLRNPDDRSEAQTRPATLADIRYRQERPVPELSGKNAPERDSASKSGSPLVFLGDPQPETYHILTLRGSRRGHVQVTAGGE